MSLLGIIVWVVATAVIIGVFVWTMRDLIRQKKIWRDYAASHGFRYAAGRFMSSPAMAGDVDGWQVRFFSEEKKTGDQLGRRFVSVIEIEKAKGLVDGGAAGTSGMSAFMRQLDLLSPFEPKSSVWQQDKLIYARENKKVKAFWTEPRLTILLRMLNTKNTEALFLFDDKQSFLRLETSDPLCNPDKIDEVVRRRIADLEALGSQ